MTEEYVESVEKACALYAQSYQCYMRCIGAMGRHPVDAYSTTSSDGETISYSRSDVHRMEWSLCQRLTRELCRFDKPHHTSTILFLVAEQLEQIWKIYGKQNFPGQEEELPRQVDRLLARHRSHDRQQALHRARLSEVARYVAEDGPH